MSAKTKSGRVWLAESRLHYASQDYGSWDFPVADLRVWGEYTTGHGPGIDDWFMVFVTDPAHGWYEASVYAEGVDEIRAKLAEALGTEVLHSDLFSSTDYASCIIWPATLRSQPLFEFTTVPMPWWQRWLRLGIGQIRTRLSSKVRQYLEPPG